MWDNHYRLWVLATQIRRGREPTTTGSYSNTIMCRYSRHSYEWSRSFHAGSAQCSDTFTICPFLVLLLLIPWITSLRALVELSSGCFQVRTSMPFSIGVHKLILRRGNIHPTLFRNFRPKLDMEANQPLQQENLIITPPPCVTAPKSDVGRVSTG